MKPEDTKPACEAPSKKSMLGRYAMWSGVATVAVPVSWAVLTSVLGGNAGLAVGWFGVLPVILFVPVGIIITLGLAIAASVAADKQKETTKDSDPTTANPNDRNA